MANFLFNCKIIDGTKNFNSETTSEKIINYLKDGFNFITNSKIKDFSVVLEINAVHIGITTMGDAPYLLEKAFNTFNKNNCEIMFCACLTRGSTINYLKNIQNKKEITFIEKEIANSKNPIATKPTSNEMNEANQLDIKKLLVIVFNLLNCN